MQKMMTVVFVLFFTCLACKSSNHKSKVNSDSGYIGAEPACPLVPKSTQEIEAACGGKLPSASSWTSSASWSYFWNNLWDTNDHILPLCWGLAVGIQSSLSTGVPCYDPKSPVYDTVAMGFCQEVSSYLNSRCEDFDTHNHCRAIKQGISGTEVCRVSQVGQDNPNHICESIVSAAKVKRGDKTECDANDSLCKAIGKIGFIGANYCYGTKGK